MKKIKMIIMFIGIFLLMGAVNVKAYNVTSLTGDFTITINKFMLNLYEEPAENATTVELFSNPITFELPMSSTGFEITRDTLISKSLKIDENRSLSVSLVQLEDNIDEDNIDSFLNDQTFDKTKRYYGDIEVEYTVNTFPASFNLTPTTLIFPSNIYYYIIN